jgi:hypothetical protein
LEQKIMKLSAVPFCILLVPICSSAQQNNPAVASSQDNAKAATSSMLAGTHAPAEMNKLYPRIGEWQATIRTMPGPGSPEGGVDQGVMVIRKGPGGFSIVQDFQSHGFSGHLIGQSYTWWDSRTKAYKSVWCDNMQGCTEFTTAIQGNSWTVELDGTTNGTKVHTTIHATLSQDHNRIHEEFKNSYDGGPPRIVTVGEYLQEMGTEVIKGTHPVSYPHLLSPIEKSTIQGDRSWEFMSMRHFGRRRFFWNRLSSLRKRSTISFPILG